MTKIYHLALAKNWQKTVEQNGTYYPPTYDLDGFIHGTAEAGRLIEVANHFYTDSVGDWLCLEMTEESLSKLGVKVIFESPADVGAKESKAEHEEMLFPHIYGGLHPNAITATYPVIRNPDGTFAHIELDKPID